MAFITEAECMSALTQDKGQLGTSCPTVYDGVLCWPDTPTGSKVLLPCPPLKNLDPRQHAVRECLTTGQWQAKSNYSACYTVEARKEYEKFFTPSDSAKIRATVDVAKRVGLAVQVISLVCLVLALILLILLVARSRRGQASRCALLVCALIACCLQHLAQLLYRQITASVDHGCLLVAALVAFASSVVCFSLLAHLVLTSLRIAWRPVGRVHVIVAVVVVTLSSAACTTAWLVATYEITPREACELFQFINAYHWILTAPTLLALLLALVLNAALVTRLICWSSRFKAIPNFKVIRHSCLLLLFVTVYLLFCQIFTLVHSHVADDGFSPAIFYLSNVIFWVKGIVLSLFLCFLDLEVLSYCPCACVNLDDDAAEEDGEEQPLSSWRSIKEGSGQQDQTHEVTQVSSFEREVKPMTNVQSRLVYGSLGMGK